MSMFLGTTSGTAGVGIQCCANDTRIVAERYDDDWCQEIPKASAWNNTQYLSEFWPGNGGMDASGNEMLSAVWRDRPCMNSGAVAAVGFVGYSRDAYGSVLGGCTMKLFKTADGSYPNTKDTKVYEVVSDATTGWYSLYTPYYPDTHYIVSFKTGTPDVQGVTVNTLIGA
jgi:hypothetical protein